jgi:hypothetical protein
VALVKVPGFRDFAIAQADVTSFLDTTVEAMFDAAH